MMVTMLATRLASSASFGVHFCILRLLRTCLNLEVSQLSPNTGLGTGVEKVRAHDAFRVGRGGTKNPSRILLHVGGSLRSAC